MIESNKRNKLLVWLALIIVILALALLYLWLRTNGYLQIFESTESLQEYVASFGVWAPVIFILLQIVQVILAPIPGNVTTLAGGAMFGFWPAMLYSILAVFIGSMVCFGIGRTFGKRVVYKLVSAQIVDKYLNVLANKQRTTLALLFLFPFFPDDALCLLAGLTGYSWKWFACMILITRPWGLIFSALIGSGSLIMPMWGWVILVILAAAIMLLSIKYGSVMEDWLLHKIHKQEK